MFGALLNRVAIERERYIISLHGNGGEEAKGILLLHVGTQSLDLRVERLGNLLIAGILHLGNVAGTKTNVFTES